MASTAHTRLSALLLVNALFNAAGAVILVVAPPWLDLALGLGPRGDFLWHLLAACSLALAIVSFLASRFHDPHAVRAIVITFLVFHGTSALVSVWAIAAGLPVVVWANTAIHLLFFGLFWLLGFRLPPDLVRPSAAERGAA